MLRRAIPVSCTIATYTVPALTRHHRSAHHAQTHHNFTNCFTRKLTPEESQALATQEALRPVSAVVPGKVFMRHWIAAEQSTVSVVNRVMSGIICVCLMLWACGYATLGYNGHNSAHIAGWTFIAYWFVLHTHCMMLIPVFATLAVMQLLLN